MAAARAAYIRAPSAQEMAAAGFTPEDFEEEAVELWPENWPAWSLFCELSGQWRVSSMGGPVALDYTAVFARMDRLRLDDAAWHDLFADLRVIEAAALKQMQSQGH